MQKKNVFLKLYLELLQVLRSVSDNFFNFIVTEDKILMHI